MDNPNILGHKRIGKLLWDFSLPAIVGMMVTALYNLVDSIFVGHGVGAVGLAAVSIAFPIMIVMMGFGMLVGVGATTLISIRIGEQKRKEAEKILGNALVLGLLFAVSLSAISLLFLETLLIWLGADQTVLPYAIDFTQIILLGSIFMFTGFGLNNIIRAEGHPRIAMMTMIISAGLNMILNPLFIFGLGLGIKGSALATVVSQAVSAVWVVGHFLGPYSVLKFHWANLNINKGIAMNIMAMGSSSFFMQIAASVVAGLFNNILVLHGGQAAVAAMGVINRVSMMMMMPLFGIGQGMQPIVGYNFGAKNYKRVKDATKKAAIAATVVALVGFILVQVFDAYIMRLFSPDPDLIDLGAAGLRVVLITLPLVGFQVVGSMFFQAIGKPTHSLLLSMSRQVLILIPVLLVLPRYWGLWGVWLAGPLSDLVATLLTAILFIAEIRRLNRRILLQD